MMLSDVCLSDVCLTLAGWLPGAYWLIGPGLASLAQGCCCALPLQARAEAYCGGCLPTACIGVGKIKNDKIS